MGSSSTTKTENKIPAYLEEAGQMAVERAKQIQEMGYLPYMGPEVAALNPYEQAMAQNVGSMASAYGMAAPVGIDMSGVDTATAGGVTGYTTSPAYFSALESLRETRPDQYEFFRNLTRFDPLTGQLNPDFVGSQQAATSAPSYNFSAGEYEKLISDAMRGPNSSRGSGDRPWSSGPTQVSGPSGIPSTRPRPRPSTSGGFDPLGPSGNYSVNVGSGIKNTIGDMLFGG